MLRILASCKSTLRRLMQFLLKSFSSFLTRTMAYLKTSDMTNSEGFFSMYKSFFRRNTLCIARKNEAVQRKKDRCLGVLTVFRYALIQECRVLLTLVSCKSTTRRLIQFSTSLRRYKKVLNLFNENWYYMKSSLH